MRENIGSNSSARFVTATPCSSATFSRLSFLVRKRIRFHIGKAEESKRVAAVFDSGDSSSTMRSVAARIFRSMAAADTGCGDESTPLHQMVTRLILSVFLLFACANLFGATVTKSFRELTAKGDADLLAGNLDAAIAAYNRIIALNLTLQLASLAVMRRGNCYYAKHDLDRAIADFDQALRIDPRN